RTGPAAGQHHGLPVPPAGEVGAGPARVDPCLLPDLFARQVDVEAAAILVVLGHPVLADAAAVVDLLDQALGDHLVLAGRRHLPAADPEIELAVLGRGAGGLGR